YFNYTVRSSFRGNDFKTAIELATFVDQIEPSGFKRYIEDMRSLANITTGVAVVPKTAIRATRTVAVAKKDFAQTLRDQQQETIDKTTQAIRSGKLTGSDLAGAYCLRSSARSDLGMPKDGLADADEAVKLTPSSPDSLRCRAYAYFAAGEFDKTIADYSKSIALGAADGKVLLQRGIAKFYAGKLADAAEDFAKASDVGDKESQAYADLWLLGTYQRLGQPIPDSLRERAATDARGDWPRPALAVVVGKLTPEEMLKLLERKSGDERRMATSEGYFYLGQYYMRRGDKIKAGEFFEKVRRLNMVTNTEHKAAGFELQYLGPLPEPMSHEASAARGKPTGSLPASASAADRPQT